MISLSLLLQFPYIQLSYIIRDLLKKDEKLNDRTVLSVQNIMELLGFLSTQYLLFLSK